VQVRHDEGVASHIGPKPCTVIREDDGEASARESIGQPLSRERRLFRVLTLYSGRKATPLGAPARARSGPGVVADPGMCRRSLNGNREIPRLAGGGAATARIGKARSRSR